jgi:hypothetical protein
VGQQIPQQDHDGMGFGHTFGDSQEIIILQDGLIPIQQYFRGIFAQSVSRPEEGTAFWGDQKISGLPSFQSSFD